MNTLNYFLLPSDIKSLVGHLDIRSQLKALRKLSVRVTSVKVQPLQMNKRDDGLKNPITYWRTNL
jgi:hypothetical protein